MRSRPMTLPLKLPLRKLPLRRGRSRATPCDSPGQGMLPAACAELVTLAAAFRDPSSLLRFAPLRVLLVDDCPLQQLLACALLSRWEILPEIASDGVEAVLRAGEQDFDIILMDVEMPVMDGLTATAHIRRDERARHSHKRVPVVAYTSASLASDEARWQQSGMNAVLHKPSDVLEMGECLERWCADKLFATQH